MAKHKKQHYVPVCYLKSWCDLTALRYHDPYVWQFDADGSNSRKRAPKNIFYETDMYTIQSEDGSRDLTLESGLSQLETEFARLRISKLKRRRVLNPADHFTLCAFAAAAHARTPAQRDHQREQWGRPLDRMEEMLEWSQSESEGEKRQFAAAQPPSLNTGKSLSYDDVKKLHSSPMQSLLRPMISVEAPLLYKLDLAIFFTSDKVGFITSDNPCVWFDPKSYERPPMYRGPALAYESIEITLPLSPWCSLFLNRAGFNGYMEASPPVVDELNRRLRFHADKHFIVNTNTKKDVWFDPGTEPDNSWDKLHAADKNP